MPIDPLSLAQFTNNAASIVAADPLQQQEIVHNTNAWREKMLQNEQASAALDGAIEFLDGNLTINRQNIFDAVAQNIDPQARFIMQMIWGYSDNGRSRARVLNYFQANRVNNAESYAAVVNSIHAGNFQQAYAQLCEVDGLSTSFISKVLYFESRHLPPSNAPQYALIMDDRVSAGIVKVVSPWAHECVTIYTPRPGEGHQSVHKAWEKYWQYVNGCHEIAAAIGTNADHLEYFLFGA